MKKIFVLVPMLALLVTGCSLTQKSVDNSPASSQPASTSQEQTNNLNAQVQDLKKQNAEQNPQNNPPLNISNPAPVTYTSASNVSTNEQKVLATAREVIGSLSARDYQKLEGLVSPDGLSLDLYPRFDLTRNLIAKNAVSLIPNDTKIYLWGYTDGKGDPINLTRAEFLTKYIYTNSVDYLKAPDVAVNKILGSGNSINTIDKDVNGRTYVAFHFLGFDPKYAGMDWTTLYLVFDLVNGEYKLRGIAKDNWTI